MKNRASLPARLLATALGLAAAFAAWAEGGTISGKVDVQPAKYLEETVVYLKSVPGTYKPQTHDMDQQGMKFVPHILVVTEGDTVKFLNHDNVVHNVYSPDNEGYNLGSFKQNEDRTYTFAEAGRVLAALQHPPRDAGLHLRRPESPTPRRWTRRAATSSRTCHPAPTSSRSGTRSSRGRRSRSR